MMSRKPDPKATAQRLFATPDTCVGLIEIGKRYATDAPDTVRTPLEAVAPRGPNGEHICELGFGSGWLLEEMAKAFVNCRLYGVDLSMGMAQRAQGLYGGRVAVLVGDMERLPFRDESLDAAVTCWTLYFMRDIDGALVEIRR